MQARRALATAAPRMRQEVEARRPSDAGPVPPIPTAAHRCAGTVGPLPHHGSVCRSLLWGVERGDIESEQAGPLRLRADARRATRCRHRHSGKGWGGGSGGGRRGANSNKGMRRAHARGAVKTIDPLFILPSKHRSPNLRRRRTRRRDIKVKTCKPGGRTLALAADTRTGGRSLDCSCAQAGRGCASRWRRHGSCGASGRRRARSAPAVALPIPSIPHTTIAPVMPPGGRRMRGLC